MFLIQNVLISSEIIHEEFICNLSACKGACCWEGDFGAPLLESEVQILEESLSRITPYLIPKSIQTIQEKGCSQDYDKGSFHGTMLEESGACSFMIIENGIASCGIEKAYRSEEINWRKPQSCYLYPIRVSKNEEIGFEAWNYDQWDICSAACAKGKQEKVKVYQFLKDPITAYKGAAFYEELDALAHTIV